MKTLPNNVKTLVLLLLKTCHEILAIKNTSRTLAPKSKSARLLVRRNLIEDIFERKLKI